MSYIDQIVILQCGPPSYTPFQKRLSFPFSLGKKRIYPETQVKGELLIYFENCQGAPYSHRQSSNRMMNSFVIVNITPICK